MNKLIKTNQKQNSKAALPLDNKTEQLVKTKTTMNRVFILSFSRLLTF